MTGTRVEITIGPNASKIMRNAAAALRARGGVTVKQRGGGGLARAKRTVHEQLADMLAHDRLATRAGALKKPEPAEGQGDMVAGTAVEAQNEAHAGGIAAGRLRSIVERVERLGEENKALSGDIRDIFAEAASAGFSVPTIKAILRLRRREAAEVEEEETLLHLYKRAMGM